MPAVSGSFSGNVKVQTAITLSDQSNHELNLAEIGGTQKSSDEKWNNAAITYWGTTDVVEGKGHVLLRRGLIGDVEVDGEDGAHGGVCLVEALQRELRGGRESAHRCEREDFDGLT